MYYVYILKSQKNSGFYTGLTEDVSRRLYEHNAGHVKSTKGRRPFEVVHMEAFATRAEARVREKYFKTGSGRELRDSLLKKNIPR